MWFCDNYTIKKLNCNTFYKGNHKVFESDYQKEESIEELKNKIDRDTVYDDNYEVLYIV